MKTMKIAALVSEFFYRLVEVFDAFVIISKKFTRSLEFRKAWRRVPRKKSQPIKLWLHGASVGELEDLANFFLSPEKLAKAGLSASQLMITASSVSAESKLAHWGKEMPFAYAGPIPPEREKECADFLREFSPEALLLSHGDVWPRLFEKAASALPRGLLWLPQKNTRPSLLKRLCLVPWLKVHLLRSIDWESSWASKFIGNPRIDRILSRIEQQEQSGKMHILEAFGGEPDPEKLNLIVGSAWYEDTEMLAQALGQISERERQNWKVVVIPHDPQDSLEVARMKKSLPEGHFILEEGILLESYAGFDVAMVGGGYRSGLHNVVEPALWHIPTFCGPMTEKQPEALQLWKMGQLSIFEGSETLAQHLRAFLERDYRNAQIATATQAREFLLSHRGATDRLADFLKDFLA
jgi:3-deoxy-D-manno-octulosonic-acid transferase